MTLLFRELALLIKTESVYGSDAAPSATANAIVARNVVINPLATQRESRDLYTPWLGNGPEVMSAYWGSIRFEVEMTSSGTLGTAPAWGPLLRACQFAEVVETGVRVFYQPITRNFDSVTAYAFVGGVRHRLTGMRGNVSMRWQYRQVPVFAFDMMGLFTPVTDAAVPTNAVYSAWREPLAMNKQNTPTFSLHGVSGMVLQNLSVEMNIPVSYRNMVGDESVRLGDRKPAGSIVMGAELMSVRNWFDTIRNATQGALNLVHGTVAGDIVELQAFKTQLVDASYSEFEGDRMLNAAVKFNPNAGNDEVVIIAR